MPLLLGFRIASYEVTNNSMMNMVSQSLGSRKTASTGLGLRAEFGVSRHGRGCRAYGPKLPRAQILSPKP